MSGSARVRRVLAWALLAGAGCGIAPVEPDPDRATPLALLAVIEAGDTAHFVELLGFSRRLVSAGARMEVRRGGAVHTRDGALVDDLCLRLGGGAWVGTHACLRIGMDVFAGDDVEVVAWVPGLDTVRGRATVPEPFAVRVAPEGGTASSGSWRVSWTPSAGAAAYLVEVRDWTTCTSTSPCEAVVAMRTTELSVLLPPLPTGGLHPLNVTVSALDPNLDAFATTGVPGEVFTQLPLSSVRGGLGVVGSRTRGTPAYVKLGGGP